MVTARMLWPAPVLIEASPGTYLEVVGASDALHPVVQRPNDATPTDEPASDAGPVLLANEVQQDGRSRPIVVASEGFVGAWAQEGDGAEQLTAWATLAELERNRVTQEASIRSRDARGFH